MNKSIEWSTPYELFNRLNKEFDFNLDVCATDTNAKCDMYYTKAENGLEQDWSGYRCWMNPPYGREIGEWMKKAADTFGGGGERGLCVCLIPVRTDTRWWQDDAMRATEIRLLRGRVKFVPPKDYEKGSSGPDFASALVIFGTRRMPIFTSYKV